LTVQTPRAPGWAKPFQFLCAALGASKGHYTASSVLALPVVTFLDNSHPVQNETILVLAFLEARGRSSAV
jgi:hypothetical protein